MELRKKLKLSSKFFGPFAVVEKIGAVAYMLQLPTGSRIHPVFYVSKLQKRIGDDQQAKPVLLLFNKDDQIMVRLEAVLQHKVILRNSQHVPQVLIRWLNPDPMEVSREDETFIKVQFPNFAISRQ